jgi:hypothetical protein
LYLERGSLSTGKQTAPGKAEPSAGSTEQSQPCARVVVLDEGHRVRRVSAGQPGVVELRHVKEARVVAHRREEIEPEREVERAATAVRAVLGPVLNVAKVAVVVFADRNTYSLLEMMSHCARGGIANNSTGWLDSPRDEVMDRVPVLDVGSVVTMTRFIDDERSAVAKGAPRYNLTS